MFYKNFKPFFFIYALLILVSCEEVIILDLNSTEPQLVIEANLNVTDHLCKVSISQSDGFYSDNSFDKISGASISLQNSSGNNYILDDLGGGQYMASDIMATSGDTFSIHFDIPDYQSFSASALVPSAVHLDSLIIEEDTGGIRPNGGNSDGDYNLTVEWKDIEGEDNFYRIKVFRNDIFQSDVYVLSDDLLGDGAKLARPVIGERYALGDELRVQLLSVNKGYYKYFSDIANGEGRGLSAPVPFNPQGNIEQNILGYFGILEISEKTIIVE